jgi:hypothetical protein
MNHKQIRGLARKAIASINDNDDLQDQLPWLREMAKGNYKTAFGLLPKRVYHTWLPANCQYEIEYWHREIKKAADELRFINKGGQFIGLSMTIID